MKLFVWLDYEIGEIWEAWTEAQNSATRPDRLQAPKRQSKSSEKILAGSQVNKS